MKPPLEPVEDYFRSKLLENGSTARGVDWKDEASQQLRFEVINRYIDFSLHPSILDVGCGTGEYLNYTQQLGHSIDYHGIDIVEEMVECTNARFGEGTASRMDISAIPNGRPYDYVIASGTFNAKLNCHSAPWRDYFFQSLSHMYQHCTRSVIFNCMSPRVDFRYRRLFYPDASDLVNFIVTSLSRDFIMDHSYPLYEMTVCVNHPSR